MATQVRRCTCKSDFQDRVYGNGMRLFNEGGKDKVSELHCTVCGKVIGLDGGVKKH